MLTDTMSHLESYSRIFMINFNKHCTHRVIIYTKNYLTSSSSLENGFELVFTDSRFSDARNFRLAETAQTHGATRKLEAYKARVTV